MKQVTIKDFLTDDEIRFALKLHTAYDICEQVIKPSIRRINRDLGQENDPMYLAYAVEYALSQYRKESNRG